MTDPLAIARSYAKSALSGRGVTAGRWIKAAAERFLVDLKAARERNSVYVYSRDHADAAVNFIQLLPHIKGEFARRNELLILEPWQIFLTCNIFGFIRRADQTRRYRRALITVSRKNGKALALDTPIPTPDGWKSMTNIHAGDRVFDEDGKVCTVINESPVFIDHDCYEVTFSNGEKVIADAGHLWKTTARINMPGNGLFGRKIKRTHYPKLIKHMGGWYARIWRGKLKHIGRLDAISEQEAQIIFNGIAQQDLADNPVNQDSHCRVRTTQEIYNTLHYGRRSDLNHSIDMPGPLDLPDADLPIPPYVLGAWLGDGTSTSTTITAGEADAATMRRELEREGAHIEEHRYIRSRTAVTLQVRLLDSDLFGEMTPAGKESSNNLRKRLREINVLDNKHIPSIYLRASYRQRLALLQGLMDTDGTADRAGRGQVYTTISKQLADGVAELLASLGVKFACHKKPLKCNGKPVEGTGYNLQFHCFRDELPVFRMPRKLARMRLRSETKTAARCKTVQITNVVPIQSIPVKCISVNSPSHLFRFGKTMLPTHNSSYASAVGLYMLCADEEAGPEIYALATTRDQAGIVFSDARAMVRKSPQLAEYYGVEAGALAIFRNSAHGTFKPLPGDPGDGTNPHCAIIDEYHEHQSPRAYDAMYSGMGARRQPLILVTTTAGYNRAGPCYQMEAYSKKVLNGDIDDPSLFAALYTLDDGDQWTDPRVWVKANPNLGVSVSRDNLEEACFEAQNNSVKQVNFLTKRMNIWLSAGAQWMDARDWNACADESLRLEDFAGRPAYLGLDLASKIDLCALEILIQDGERWVRFGKYYLPEEPVQTGAGNTHAHYYAWSLDGRLTLTPGNITDYAFIKNDIADLCALLDVQAVAFDPFQGAQLSSELLAANIPMIETRMTVLGLSQPMKELHAWVKGRKIAHDGCPVMAWQMSNVVAHVDAKENIYPRKEVPDNKIDSVVALILAVSRAMLGEPVSTESVYNERPLLVF